MKRLVTLTALCLASMALAFAAQPPSLLVVQNAWMRQPPGGDTAAVYLTLRNTGTEAATVVGAQSPIAVHAMLHESKTSGGQSTMRHLDSLVIAPGQSIALQPGGVHVMLSGLKTSIAIGEKVPLVLVLADGSQLHFAALVRPLNSE